MPEFLAVHVETLTPGLPTGAVQVDFFDGVGLRPVTQPANPPGPGTVQIACPASPRPARVRITVAEQPTLWSVDMTLPIRRQPDGTPHAFATSDINFTGARTDDRGRGDFTVHVFITMSSIKDGSAQALDPALGASNLTFRTATPSSEGFSSRNFTFSNAGIFSLPFLGRQPFVIPDQQGWDRVRKIPSDAQPVGRVYFAQRKAPRGSNLLVVWRPSVVDLDQPTRTADAFSDFHVFFHPSIHPRVVQDKGKPPRLEGWGPYPFGPNFIELAQRYLFTQMHLAAQHWLTRKRVVLVFPIGSQDHQMGDLAQWTELMRALRELNFFMHKIDGQGSIAARTRPIDRVALSGVSFGIQFAEPLIGQSDGHLREVYSFDGVDANGGSATFVGAMAAWLARRDGVQRFFKIYTQDAANLQLRNLVTSNPANVKNASFTASILHGGRNVRISADTVELHDDMTNPTRSIALLPHAYWEQLPPVAEGTLDDHGNPMNPAMRLYSTVHRAMTVFFAHHAIRHSGFRDPRP